MGLSYKHRVFCYLLSHINALSSETTQVALLKSTATISDKAKIQILLPTIQSVVKRVSLVQPSETFSSVSKEFATRLLSCYDSSAAGCLNETAQPWDVFLQVIRTFFRSGMFFAFQITALNFMNLAQTHLSQPKMPLRTPSNPGFLLL